MVHMGKISRFKLSRILCHILLVIITIVVLAPILLMLMDSVKDYSEFMTNTFGIPKKFDFSSYPQAFMKAKFYYAFPNSLYITVLAEFFLVILGSLAAYPIARINLKMNKIILRIFLAGMVVPLQVIAVPLFTLLRKADLINSLTVVSLLFVATFLPITIFIYSGFIKGIPKELEEASIIDGCGPVSNFFRIIFPLAKPATLTVVILTSLDIWNNFFYPLIFLTSQKKSTLSVAVFSFKSFEVVKWPDLFAAMTMIVLPIIILYLVLQKQFIRGMVSGAVKG